MKLKKLIYAGIGGVITLSLGFIIWMNLNTPQQEKTQETTELVSSGEVNFEGDIDYEKYPMLYDYKRSSLGQKWDGDGKNTVAHFNNYYAILVKESDMSKSEGTAYVTNYRTAQYLPALGSGYATLKLKGNEWKALVQSLNDLKAQFGNEYNYAEGGYRVFISSDRVRGDNFTKLGDLKLTSLEYPTGYWTQEQLQRGIPSEWLRKEPYYTNIKNKVKVDLKDKFFDNFNFRERFVLKTKKEGSYKTIWVDVVGANKFLESDYNFQMDLQQLIVNLENWKYDVEPIKARAK